MFSWMQILTICSLVLWLSKQVQCHLSPLEQSTFSHRSDYRKTIHLLILSPLKHIEHVLRSQMSIQFCLKHIFAHKSTVIHWSSSFSVFLLGNPLKQRVKLGVDPHFFPTFFLLLMDEMVSDRLCIHHFLNRVSVDDKRNFYCVNRVSQYLK